MNKQKIFVVLDDFEEIIHIASTKIEAETYCTENANANADSIEERSIDTINHQPFNMLYVVNDEMFSVYDEVNSTIFTNEKDARKYMFDKTKEFKTYCAEYMNEYPYIEKEDNVELENCFIIAFSKYDLTI